MTFTFHFAGGPEQHDLKQQTTVGSGPHQVAIIDSRHLAANQAMAEEVAKRLCLRDEDVHGDKNSCTVVLLMPSAESRPEFISCAEVAMNALEAATSLLTKVTSTMEAENKSGKEVEMNPTEKLKVCCLDSYYSDPEMALRYLLLPRNKTSNPEGGGGEKDHKPVKIYGNRKHLLQMFYKFFNAAYKRRAFTNTAVAHGWEKQQDAIDTLLKFLRTATKDEIVVPSKLGKPTMVANTPKLEDADEEPAFAQMKEKHKNQCCPPGPHRPAIWHFQKDVAGLTKEDFTEKVGKTHYIDNEYVVLFCRPSDFSAEEKYTKFVSALSELNDAHMDSMTFTVVMVLDDHEKSPLDAFTKNFWFLPVMSRLINFCHLCIFCSKNEEELLKETFAHVGQTEHVVQLLQHNLVPFPRLHFLVTMSCVSHHDPGAGLQIFGEKAESVLQKHDVTSSCVSFCVANTKELTISTGEGASAAEHHFPKAAVTTQEIFDFDRKLRAKFACTRRKCSPLVVPSAGPELRRKSHILRQVVVSSSSFPGLKQVFFLMPGKLLAKKMFFPLLKQFSDDESLDLDNPLKWTNPGFGLDKAKASALDDFELMEAESSLNDLRAEYSHHFGDYESESESSAEDNEYLSEDEINAAQHHHAGGVGNTNNNAKHMNMNYNNKDNKAFTNAAASIREEFLQFSHDIGTWSKNYPFVKPALLMEGSNLFLACCAPNYETRTKAMKKDHDGEVVTTTEHEAADNKATNKSSVVCSKERWFQVVQKICEALCSTLEDPPELETECTAEEFAKTDRNQDGVVQAEEFLHHVFGILCCFNKVREMECISAFRKAEEMVQKL
ncbi:unnamed protein product [Amoebophrya sp. A120]|nr:unnamed protein product [Amoebophrya sp. A120]|eukprot:GSA120T00024911001.1